MSFCGETSGVGDFWVDYKLLLFFGNKINYFFATGIVFLGGDMELGVLSEL